MQTKTQSSVRSNVSGSSTKGRLRQTREKQQKQHQLKKLLLQEKMKRDSVKSLKAEQRVLSRSRNVSNRRQQAMQTADYNRKQKQLLSKQEINEHLNKLKYKMQRTQLIRMRRMEHKTDADKNRICIQLKKSLDSEKAEVQRMRWETKMQRAQQKRQQTQRRRSQIVAVQRKYRQAKEHHAHQIVNQRYLQSKHHQTILVRHVKQRQWTAQINRAQQQQFMQLRGKNHREIRVFQANRKKNILLRSQEQENASLRLSLNHKFQRLQQAETLKKKLIKDRLKMDKKFKKAVKFMNSVV